jgi:sulfur-carrier protein
MAHVRLDAMLRGFVPTTTLQSDAATLLGLLDDLEQRFPRLRNRLRDETGHIRPFVKLFVNGAEVRPAESTDRPLQPSDEVDVLHSIQGG